MRLAGAAEAAALLGVSRQQVHRLAARADFPEPLDTLATGRVWLWAELELWAREHADRRRGRPETRPPAGLR